MEEVLAAYVGRLAPSPTGALHLGNVRTFMVAWLRARACGGRVILRTEDLDHPKDKPGAAAQAREDLRWLGFDWDAEYVQSERRDLYRAALDYLRAQGRAYPCVCSRRDVAAAQSAPHAGEQLFYPGTCRGRFATWAEACAVKPQPCWRFRVDDGETVAFDDVFAGPFSQDVARTLGDFPLARDPGGAGYTLAVVVDDLLMGVTEVVRGDDLLPATPAQILLARALGRRINRRVDERSFQRIKDTEHQSRLSGDKRRTNLVGAFAVTDARGIRGRTVLLVDDVMTSGNTFAHCAKALVEGGAYRVWCVSVARRLKD